MFIKRGTFCYVCSIYVYYAGEIPRIEGVFLGFTVKKKSLSVY